MNLKLTVKRFSNKDIIATSVLSGYSNNSYKLGYSDFACQHNYYLNGVRIASPGTDVNVYDENGLLIDSGYIQDKMTTGSYYHYYNDTSIKKYILCTDDSHKINKE